MPLGPPGFRPGRRTVCDRTKEILDQHPVAKYGCTLCHGSQGYATDMDAAHSVGNANWGEPLLGGELGKFNLISNREALIQVNCNICRTGGASLINRKSLLVGNAKGEL